MNFSRLPIQVSVPIYLAFFLLQIPHISAEAPNESSLSPFDDRQHLAAISEYHSNSLGRDDIFKELQATLNASFGPVRPSHPQGSRNKFPEPSKAKTATGHIINGIYLHQQKKYLDAERHYRAALNQYPDYAFAHFNLGLLYADMKQWAEAEDSYKKALLIDPSYYRAHNDLGILYARQKKYKSAKQEFWKVIKLNSKEPAARLNLGHLYYYLERNYRKAKRHYQIALKLNPELIHAKSNINKIDDDMKKSIEDEGLFEASQWVDYDFNQELDLAKKTSEITQSEPAKPIYKKRMRPPLPEPLF